MEKGRDEDLKNGQQPPNRFMNPSCPGSLYYPKSATDIWQRAREAREEFRTRFGKGD